MKRTKKYIYFSLWRISRIDPEVFFFFLLLILQLFFLKNPKISFLFLIIQSETKRWKEDNKVHTGMFESEKKEKIHERLAVRRSEVSRPSGNTVRQWQHFSTPSQSNTMVFFFLLYSHSDCFLSVSGKDKTSGCTFETLLRSEVVRYATMDTNIFGG